MTENESLSFSSSEEAIEFIVGEQESDDRMRELCKNDGERVVFTIK